MLHILALIHIHLNLKINNKITEFIKKRKIIYIINIK